jgi:hypothetical protein
MMGSCEIRLSGWIAMVFPWLSIFVSELKLILFKSSKRKEVTH